MKKRSLIRAVISVALIAYLVVALSLISADRAKLPCRGLIVEIGQSDNGGFVTEEAIKDELGDLANVAGKPLSRINTDVIECRLDKVEDIEDAVVTRTPDGFINVSIVPMKPVARVFNPDGSSYYVNHNGKRMKASLRYRIDVPVIVNEGYDRFDPLAILPTLDYITSNEFLNRLTTAINVTRQGDIVIVPAIRGMIINLGDTANLNNKMDRLMTMYHKVLPVKGWSYYDTLSVKWSGQVVATRRLKPVAAEIPIEDLMDDEGDDIGTIEADSTAVKLSNKFN